MSRNQKMSSKCARLPGFALALLLTPAAVHASATRGTNQTAFAGVLTDAAGNFYGVTGRPVVGWRRPEDKTSRPTVDASRPTIDLCRPAADVSRPKVDSCRPVVDVSRPTVDSYRPLVDASRPTVDSSRPEVDWRGPLAGVIRAANASMSGEQRRKHGSTTRLKPNHGKGNCSQYLLGNDQDNFLDGSMSACDETILGYDGDDILVGGPGNNTLNGGQGADVLTGGGGADTFVYERAGDSPVDAPDVITDFNPSDTLDLGGLARTAHVPLSFIGFNAFTGVPGQVNYTLVEYWKCDPDWNCYDQYLTIIGVDLAGEGVADFSIVLSGDHHPKAKNFVLGSPVQQQ